MRGKYLPIIIVVAGIGLLFLYYTFAFSGLSGSVEVGVYLGNEAVDFEFIDFNGYEYRLSGFRGSVVVVSFMTSWCPSCHVQVQHLKDLKSLYGDDVVIITILLDTKEDDARRFWKEYGIDWIIGRNVSIGSLYGIYYIPTTIVIDKDGVIRLREEGVATIDTLADVVKQYI